MTPAPRGALTLLTFSIAAVGVQALMLSPLLTDIARGLETGPKEVGFAAGAYGAGVALAALLAAPRLGRWPKRVAIRIAFAVVGAALIACGLAGDWRILAAAQFVVGLASGIIIPATYALTGDIAEPSQRARAMGKVLFGWSVAMVGGVPLAALLSAVAGWRGTFLIVAAAALAMALAAGMLPRTASGTAPPAAVRYGDVMRLPGAAVGYLCTFAYMIGFYQTYTFIGDHVRQLHDAGAWLGGTISLAYGVGFGTGVLFDRWIDARGPRHVLPPTLLFVGANYVALPLAARTVASMMFYPFVWGLLNHLCMTALVSFLGALSARMRGTVMGLFSFTTYLALGTAGFVYGPVYDAHGFAAVSLASAATLWAAAALSWLTSPQPRPESSSERP